MIAYLLAAALSCDSALTALFTPVRPRLGYYEICTTADALDDLKSGADGHHYGPAETIDALDAFGIGGTYDRGRLAQLYAGRTVRVVRGWRQQGDRFESVTLISPYPDAALRRLLPGTMVIRWILPGKSSTLER
jgi:hypothetical protein